MAKDKTPEDPAEQARQDELAALAQSNPDALPEKPVETTTTTTTTTEEPPKE